MRVVLKVQIIAICIILSFNQAYSQSPLNKSEISAFDTIFRAAANSPGYVVANKEQVNSLKKYLEKERSEQIKSLELKQKELNRLQTAMDSIMKAATVEKPAPVLAKTNATSSVLVVVVVALILLLITVFLKSFSNIKELKEGKDSYQNLVIEFDLHKKNAIERERKLMRKVIDLQNQLEIKTNPDN
jgi:hypothetical protein